MIPTLMIGDFILVNKMSYGLKVPFSHALSEPIYITGPKNPERGDVIVFKYPQDPSVFYIKRVIGVPGDTVEGKDKVVYINGEPVPHTPVNGDKIMKEMDDKFKAMKLQFFEGTMGKKKHIYQVDEDNYYKTDFEKTTVPEGYFFVMGDNRDYSYDSRYWGFVPHRHIKGKAILVWFSMIFPWNDDTTKFRYWRIGNKL
jgi:signal peptidase I